MLQVLGDIHVGHAAMANLVVDGVAVGEGGAEVGERVGHQMSGADVSGLKGNPRVVWSDK